MNIITDKSLNRFYNNLKPLIPSEEDMNKINSLLAKDGGVTLNELKTYISNGTLINELIGLGTTCKNITGTNLNTICENKTGFYMGSSLINSPDGSASWFYIINLSHNSLYSYQIAFQFSSINNIWIRYENEGNWGSWSRADHDGTVLWWADTTGTVTYPSFYSNGYKYIEIIMYHTEHGVIKSTGKLLFNHVNGTYLSFLECGTQMEYYSRIYITDSACAIHSNWEKKLNSSRWDNKDTWKIRGVIGYN